MDIVELPNEKREAAIKAPLMCSIRCGRCLLSPEGQPALRRKCNRVFHWTKVCKDKDYSKDSSLLTIRVSPQPSKAELPPEGS